MYTMENYVWGVVGYVLGAAVVMWYLCWLVGHIPYRYLRHLLIMVIFTALFTPVQAYPDQPPFLAPALVVALYEGAVYSTEGGATRALMPMLFVFLVLVAGYLGYQWWRHARAPQ